MPGSSPTFLEWEPIQDKDVANLFNRTAPVITTGSLYARHTATNPVYVLENGYELACMAQLRAWDKAGTTLQIRDTWGNLFFGAILNVHQSATDLALFQTVTLELQEVDSGSYTPTLATVMP